MVYLPTYALLTLVVVAACLVEYSGARLLVSRPSSAQNRAALVSLSACAAALALFHGNLVITNLVVLSVGLFAGMFLSRAIGSAGALMALLVTAAIVDAVSSYAGPTRWIISQARNPHGVALIQFLALSLRLKGRLVGVIGVADLMFFTVCVTAMRRLGWPGPASLVIPLLGILTALAVGLVAGLTPALPFLAAAVILYARCAPVRR